MASDKKAEFLTSPPHSDTTQHAGRSSAGPPVLLSPIQPRIQGDTQPDQTLAITPTPVGLPPIQPRTQGVTTGQTVVITPTPVGLPPIQPRTQGDTTDQTLVTTPTPVGIPTIQPRTQGTTRKRRPRDLGKFSSSCRSGRHVPPSPCPNIDSKRTTTLHGECTLDSLGSYSYCLT